MGDGTHREISNGHIAFFNGPPSSGKTSLVNSLRESLADPWFHLSLDDFRAGYSEQTWANDHADLFDRVLAGYLASLREMALLGHDILAEAVITPSRQSLYESSLGEMPIVLVGVRCDWEVAVQRESDRTDRRHGPIDLPLEDYVAVHAGLIYDFEVDTSSESPEDLCHEIGAALWKSHVFIVREPYVMVGWRGAVSKSCAAFRVCGAEVVLERALPSQESRR